MIMKYVAAILAGGRSRRFGTDKAMAKIAGKPMIAHVAHAMNAEMLAVVGHEEAARYLQATSLSDPLNIVSGPLVGVLAALNWAASLNAQWLVTAPCDVPLLPKNMAQILIAAAEAKDVDIAYAETRDGPHALCAAWRPSLAPKLEKLFADGVHPPVRDVSANKVHVMFESTEDFINVNSAEDLAGAATHLERSAISPLGSAND